jgi:hypothetical protein
MIHITEKPTPKLRKAPQPPLSYPGATPDADRATRPSLAEPPASNEELSPGDRVEGLGNFGKPTGELGTVEQANEEDAVVKWDDDGRVRLHQPWLKKVSNKVHALGKPASAEMPSRAEESIYEITAADRNGIGFPSRKRGGSTS